MGQRHFGPCRVAGECARLALFVGRVHLFLAEYALALERFREAMTLAPTEAAAMAERDLFGRNLPPALAEAKDGAAHLSLAEIYQVFGQTTPALASLETALVAGFTGEQWPEAPASELQARLLEAANRMDDAAQSYYEAGRRFLWRNDYETAAEQLRHSAELDPKRAALTGTGPMP